MKHLHEKTSIRGLRNLNTIITIPSCFMFCRIGWRITKGLTTTALKLLKKMCIVQSVKNSAFSKYLPFRLNFKRIRLSNVFFVLFFCLIKCTWTCFGKICVWTLTLNYSDVGFYHTLSMKAKYFLTLNGKQSKSIPFKRF